MATGDKNKRRQVVQPTEDSVSHTSPTIFVCSVVENLLELQAALEEAACPSHVPQLLDFLQGQGQGQGHEHPVPGAVVQPMVALGDGGGGAGDNGDDDNHDN